MFEFFKKQKEGILGDYVKYSELTARINPEMINNEFQRLIDLKNLEIKSIGDLKEKNFWVTPGNNYSDKIHDILNNFSKSAVCDLRSFINCDDIVITEILNKILSGFLIRLSEEDCFSNFRLTKDIDYIIAGFSIYYLKEVWEKNELYKKEIKKLQAEIKFIEKEKEIFVAEYFKK